LSGIARPTKPDSQPRSAVVAGWEPSRPRGRSYKSALNIIRNSLILFAACALLPTLLPVTAAAEKPAIAQPAANLGRLFYTPAQREQLDRLQITDAAAADSVITLNGIVKRNKNPQRGDGGSSVVWINGKAYTPERATGLIDGKHVTADTAPILLPGAAKAVRLKVGQSVGVRGQKTEDRGRKTEDKTAPPASAGDKPPAVQP